MRKLMWAGVACIAVILVVGGWNVLASHVLHGDVTPRSLYASVENDSGGGNSVVDERHNVCHPVATAGPGSWSCDIDDPQASAGGATYRVKVHGSCWKASGGSGSLPRTVSGCVHLQED
jgi:hypothetical protein